MMAWWIAGWLASIVGSTLCAIVITRWYLIGWRSDGYRDLVDCQQQLSGCREALEATQSVLERSVQLRTEQLHTINQKLLSEIAERQELEKALQISQQNYQSIVEDQSEMILRFTKNGTVTFANKAYCNRYQITPETCIGTNCFENIHPDYRPIALQAVSTVDSDNPLGSAVIKVQRPDGTQDWAEWNGRALFDVDGRHLGYQAIGRIVTDLVETQRKLQASELQYRSIVEDQKEWIIRIDRAGKIEFANAAFMRAKNVDSEQIASSTIWDFLESDTYAQVQSVIESVSPDNPSERMRLKTTRDGITCWEDWYGHAIYNDQQEFLCIQAVGREVTKLVQAEEELHKKEGLLRHVTRLSVLGEMVAAITHEIRQPLYSISNFAFACKQQLECDRSSDLDKIVQWNREIIGQVQRANQIIGRMRGFARRSDSEAISSSINAVLHESIALLQFDLNFAKVAITHALDDRIPDSIMDQLQIEQVLVNLIRNSCDALTATKTANPMISLRTKMLDDEILVTVEDNGPGLPDAELESIFQPFRTSKADGMGLGLAICRSIIEEHEGRIWAEANHPGLRVSFTLPCQPQALIGS